MKKDVKYIQSFTRRCAHMNVEDFADVYMEIAETAGVETAIKIHKLFKGQQILFPQKLYKKEYIYKYIKENYNGQNVRELSQKFGYSDRRIRQIINSSKSYSK